MIAHQTFVPVLTVMVDYDAAFLWRVKEIGQAGVGANICDGTGRDDACPMSEGLWRKFSDWAIEFDRTPFYSDDFVTRGWGWDTYHERVSLKMCS